MANKKKSLLCPTTRLGTVKAVKWGSRSRTSLHAAIKRQLVVSQPLFSSRPRAPLSIHILIAQALDQLHRLIGMHIIIDGIRFKPRQTTGADLHFGIATEMLHANRKR